MKTLLLILLPFISYSQSIWKIDKNDIGLMVSGAAFGAFYGWNQSIQHHHWGRGNEFWDNNVSWKNKYKDFDNGDMSQAYFLSKNVLAFTTDGFHLTQFLYGTSGIVTIGIALNADIKQYPKKQRWKYIAKKLLLTTLSERLAFNLVFHSLPSQ